MCCFYFKTVLDYFPLGTPILISDIQEMLTHIKSPYVRRWGRIRKREVSTQPNLTASVCLFHLGHSCQDRKREDSTVCPPHNDMPLLLDVNAMCVWHELSRLVFSASLHCDQPTSQENNLSDVCRLPCLEHVCSVLFRCKDPRSGKHTTAAHLYGSMTAVVQNY